MFSESFFLFVFIWVSEWSDSCIESMISTTEKNIQIKFASILQRHRSHSFVSRYVLFIKETPVYFDYILFILSYLSYPQIPLIGDAVCYCLSLSCSVQARFLSSLYYFPFLVILQTRASTMAWITPNGTGKQVSWVCKQAVTIFHIAHHGM